MLLACTEQERRQRPGRHADPQCLADAIGDGRDHRQLGLPVIDTTGRTPSSAAAELAKFIQSP